MQRVVLVLSIFHRLWNGNSICAVLCLVTQPGPTLCDPIDCNFSVHGDSPGKNTGVGCHALLQGIFPTQELNRGLLHCRWILYQLSYQRSPGTVSTSTHLIENQAGKEVPLSPRFFQRGKQIRRAGDWPGMPEYHYLLKPLVWKAFRLALLLIASASFSECLPRSHPLPTAKLLRRFQLNQALLIPFAIPYCLMIPKLQCRLFLLRGPFSTMEMQT